MKHTRHHARPANPKFRIFAPQNNRQCPPPAHIARCRRHPVQGFSAEARVIRVIRADQ
ncbi:MAG: hypothetical protein IKP54_11175 [Bacteroidales bacterium]|nr:hypothetical protein [Bacteroidales bacterium]